MNVEIRKTATQKNRCQRSGVSDAVARGVGAVQGKLPALRSRVPRPWETEELSDIGRNDAGGGRGEWATARTFFLLPLQAPVRS